MNTKTKWFMMGLVVCVLALPLSSMVQAEEGTDRGCPWKISKIAVEKWGNGRVKKAMRARGSFPINIPGVTERPDWYVNGSYVGKSMIFFNLRTVYGGYALIDKANNTVKVEFKKPPHAGQSNTHSFYFDASKIRPGGSRWY